MIKKKERKSDRTSSFRAASQTHRRTPLNSESAQSVYNDANEFISTPLTHVGQRRLSTLESAQNAMGASKEAVDDVFLLTKLFFVLLSWFGFGYIWILRLCQMLLFIAILLPAFFQVYIVWFFTSPDIVKSIPYRDIFRNNLDIYIPKGVEKSGSSISSATKKYPVVIFLNGGAWIIGYKAWCTLLGKIMIANDIILVSPDYRNFPQVDVRDMLDDCNAAIRWVKANIASYGGDPDQIWIIGHSAGSHLGALSLLNEAERERLLLHPPRTSVDHTSNSWHGYTREILSEDVTSPTWRASSIKGFIGLSGPYDLAGYADHANLRGLYRGVLAAIVRNDLSYYSPTRKCGIAGFNPNAKNPIHSFLPQIAILHGTADKTVPCHFAHDFVNSLKRCGVVDARCKVYQGKGHTDIMVEDAMTEENPMLQDVIRIVKHGQVDVAFLDQKRDDCSSGAGAGDAGVQLCDVHFENYLNPYAIRLARSINPF